ncbi:MAG: ketopantoate reductase C-terminal domain-containing protein [Xanthobacteraceae bacterium]
MDWLAGKVVALGRTYGIPTPAQEAIYAILKPYRMGRGRRRAPPTPEATREGNGLH